MSYSRNTTVNKLGPLEEDEDDEEDGDGSDDEDGKM